MSETINKGWLKDTDNVKFAPKSLIEQIQDNDGKLLSTYIDEITSSYLPLSGGTLSGDITSPTFISTNGSKFGTGFINLIGSTPFIDFHYGDSETRTSRIIEESSGTLTAQCNLKVDGEIYENGKQLKLQYAYTGDGVSGNNSFSSLQDFVAATATDLNPRLFRVKDVSTDGFMPTAGTWYRVITMYQNGYNNGNYSLDGSVLAFDSHNKIHYGRVHGKGTDDITIAWDEVVLASQLSSLVGSTHTHSYLSGWSDTRNVATTPNDYNGKFTVAGLKTDAAIGTTDGSGYSGVIGFRSWTDSTGGNAHELAFTKSGNIYHRHGATDTWNSWTQILNSGNWSSYCAAKSHSHNYAGSSSAGGAANSALVLGNDTRMNYGWNGVNYFNISGTAGNAAKVNDTPTTAWWHIMRFNHSNSSGYYTDLAIPFNDTSLYYKRITGGSVQNSGWVKVLDALNWSSYAAAASHNHSAANITSGTLGVARGGTGATTFTSGAALIGAGTGAVTTRSITNNTSLTYIVYNTNLMTTNTLAYWNGAYSSAGSSNLTYCNKGAFGTAATQNHTTSAPSSGSTALITSGAVYTALSNYLPLSGGSMTGAIKSLRGTYTSTASNRFGSSALEIRENGAVGNAQSDIGYAPSIGFHWSGRIAATLCFHHDGAFRFINQAGTDFAPLYVKSISIGAGGYGTISSDNNIGLYIKGNNSAVYLNSRSVIPPDGDSGIRSNGDKSYACGHSSYRWSAVYGASSSISTSDRKEKKDFRSFDCNENYEKLFFDLKPTIYKFIDGRSNRDHFGFISQDVEESLYKLGFDDKSFAGFCKDIRVDENENPILDENGEKYWIYSLRYEEFISLNTYMIQKSYEEIDTLKTENANLRVTNEKYEERLAKLEEIIKGLCA